MWLFSAIFAHAFPEFARVNKALNHQSLRTTQNSFVALVLVVNLKTSFKKTLFSGPNKSRYTPLCLQKMEIFLKCVSKRAGVLSYNLELSQRSKNMDKLNFQIAYSVQRGYSARGSQRLVFQIAWMAVVLQA